MAQAQERSLGSTTGFAITSLCDLRQVTSPLRASQVSLSPSIHLEVVRIDLGLGKPLNAHWDDLGALKEY